MQKGSLRVKEGDAVRWGGFAARVLHTPGHTPGSISLVIEPGAIGTALTEGAQSESRAHGNPAETQKVAKVVGR